VERQRAEDALRLASAGGRVAVVSSGDPGIFAMAAAVIEAIDEGEPGWKDIDLEIIPGLSAMQAAASRLGAPLGHDFCVISLSDNLKPWSIIERRLEAAFAADFVVALYNPASKTRPDQIGAAVALALKHRRGETPVMLARAVGSEEERLTIATLATVDVNLIDMRTLVLIGSSQTKLVERPRLPPLILTPRRYGATS
ncbi:MAG: precorrin-3B C(17)-methyltransferase, partial [Beijerinckiaceae bacterium]|nr:precorrin-3B C(17)-methyltransferase [Beijerinckiaceae bacterium]